MGRVGGPIPWLLEKLRERRKEFLAWRKLWLAPTSEESDVNQPHQEDN